MLIKFTGDIKLEIRDNTLDDGVRIHKDLDSHEHWAESNKMKFNRKKCKILLWVQKQLQKCNIGKALLDIGGCKKSLRFFFQWISSSV